jgi:hypothetical protein
MGPELVLNHPNEISINNIIAGSYDKINIWAFEHVPENVTGRGLTVNP